jgi:hypothetical protein
MTETEHVDRKSHNRFSFGTAAFVAMGDHRKKIGHMVNISRDGLAFDYIANGNGVAQLDYLDIFAAEEGFYLKKVPFNIVSDRELPRDFYWSTITMRRCSIKFDPLSPAQICQLEHFLVNQAKGGAC